MSKFDGEMLFWRIDPDGPVDVRERAGKAHRRPGYRERTGWDRAFRSPDDRGTV
jgi:hypothetical protein